MNNNINFVKFNDLSATYGKINITLGPTDFFRTSVVLNFPLSTFGLGRKIKNDLGPEEIFYRPRVILYSTAWPKV